MDGAGYDISPSNAKSSAQAAQQQAGTVINFGAGASTHGGWFEQDGSASSSASAAKQGASASADPLNQFDGGGNSKLMIGVVAGATILILAAVILTRKN